MTGSSMSNSRSDINWSSKKKVDQNMDGAAKRNPAPALDLPVGGN
jgi:hypothetical protein